MPRPTDDTRYIRIALECLEQAMVGIEPQYFHLPTATRNSRTLLAYRERVYCYELYHLWRELFTKSAINQAPPLICGEVDKRGNELFKGTTLEQAIPDFLLHHPGSERNLMVIEVKPGIRRAPAIADDIIKLNRFLQTWPGYKVGCLIIYGMPRAKWSRVRVNVQRSVARKLDVSDQTQKIQIWLHESPNQVPEILSYQ